MLKLLLGAFLLHTTLGSYLHFGQDKSFENRDKYIFLDPAGYFFPVDPKNPSELDTNKKTLWNGNPHYLWGIRKDAHRRAYFNRITKSATISKLVIEYLHVLPFELNGTISCVQVYDRLSPHKGGNVELSNGGTGADFVDFLFTSKWDDGMDYLVSVFVQ